MSRSSFQLVAWRSAIVLALIVVSTILVRGSGSRHRALLSTDLMAHEGRHTKARARVIVRGTQAEIEALAARHHLSVARFLAGSAVVTVNSDELSELAADAGVDHLSGDALVRPSMSISDLSTAANQVRAGVSGGLLGLGNVPAVNGQGIGIAVIDSGISYHPALTNKVVANVSFVTGDSSVADAFGHGTHVAGIIAGNAGAAATVTPLYTGGIAPGAQLINVRVLGAEGVGLTSDVMAGINWVVTNRAKYNIRVINLSLGHPVTEPSATDPLDQAVARAVSAGIVVVASAGNDGRTADGRPILGGITSPGNSPFAVTVGAVNTWNTVARSDDTVTTYSSRGPTRFDMTVKPDLAAPGNRIVSLEAGGSYLPTMYSFLHRAGDASNGYMQLSGTSMAAPMVSGEVALLLQDTPGLVPAQVKFALQTGATYMWDAGLMGGGAGNANFWASRQIAYQGPRLPLPSALIGGVLATASGASFWDAGTLSDRLYKGDGYRLLPLLDLAKVWSDPSRLQFGDLNLVGLTNPLARIQSCPLLWGQVSTWTRENQIQWGDEIYDPQGQQILWGTNRTTEDNQILWGTTMTATDPQ